MRNRTTQPAFTRSSIPPQRTSNVVEFNVDSVRPLVSVIAKISPSPDWFIGVHDLDLCNRTNGKWVDTRQVKPVYPYDAGTDNGREFTSSEDRPSSADISRISGQPLEPWTRQERALGLFHFTKTSSTGDTATGEFESDETFVCPSKGEFESDETFVCPSKACLGNASYVIVLLISLYVALNF